MGEDYCCKVDRVVDEYDLRAPRQFDGDHDEYLVAKWTGTGRQEPTGVRPLTAWLNKQILRTVYRRHDRSDTDVRIDAEYEAVVGDDVAAHERAAVVADLEADGIDPEVLASDCIGKSTLDRHLKTCLEASKAATSGATDGRWEDDAVAYARSSFQDRVETALASLDDDDRLPGAADAELTTPILLGCPQCATRVKLDTALDRGYVCADHLGASPDQSGE
ncbi:rod-determining factor RdfA [Salinirubrum litoreum]|uniref:Rod-determining factor RdfA n=1 Tax=Salinirubrum litoreum TaxID=1126234 RepID=A0ABD5RFS9_9EURY|nr:rod-determining factor RdfA [Salinirubrum litoreum]